MLGQSTSDQYVDVALAAASGGGDFAPALDALPVPVYMTDVEGLVTYWNRACIAFAGREPQLGSDRWCITWKIYTTVGDILPHEKCPMATAIRRRQPVRDEVAIAMRPDGSRVAFRPYPTPLFDADGEMIGAVNVLVDVSAEQRAALADQASRCRRLAGATYDRSVTETLSNMADGLERTAEALSR